MLKRYFESLNKMEKINLGITGLTVVAGAALWIYGAIEEKKILKEIAEFNEQVERDTVTLNEVIYKTQEEIDELLNEEEMLNNEINGILKEQRDKVINDLENNRD